MSSNENKEQISSGSEETTLQIAKTDGSPKKTAFNWNLFDSRTQVLKDLRQKQEFVDLMLITEDGGQEVTHFAAVSALGQQFTQYINDEIKCSKDNEVVLQNGSVVKKVLVKGITKTVLKAIVDCSYSGFVRTNHSEVWPLIEAAVLYSLEDVLDLSLTFLITLLNVENCVKIFNLGLKYRHKLSNASYCFIRTNFSDVVDNCIDFPNLGFIELMELIVDDELNISCERLVFKAINRWIKGDVVQRKDKLFSLISKIRFGRLESTFIETEMAKKQLILEDRLCTDRVSKMVKDYKTLTKKKDGNGLYVALAPIEVRPRVPYEIMLAFGGWMEGLPSKTMECYDIRTNLWFDTKLSHERPRAYHGFEVIDGLIFVIGGTDGTEILNTVECFNPITKKWFEKSCLKEKRCYVSVVSINGIIYAMGGHNGRQRLKTCEKYDPISDQWTHFEPMNVIRSDASAAVHHNRIYIAGGLNDQLIENSVEFYDLNDKTWSFIRPMISPRTSLGLVSLNDYLYAIGGNNGLERLQSVERYDFKLKTWLPMADMYSKRSTFDTSILENQLFVIGGYNGQTPICSVEKYNPNENVWLKVRDLKHDRSGLAVCTIKGLSNTCDYTFIGMNNRKDKNKTKINFSGSVLTTDPNDDESEV